MLFTYSFLCIEPSMDQEPLLNASFQKHRIAFVVHDNPIKSPNTTKTKEEQLLLYLSFVIVCFFQTKAESYLAVNEAPRPLLFHFAVPMFLLLSVPNS